MTFMIERPSSAGVPYNTIECKAVARDMRSGSELGTGRQVPNFQVQDCEAWGPVPRACEHVVAKLEQPVYAVVVRLHKDDSIL